MPRPCMCTVHLLGLDVGRGSRRGVAERLRPGDIARGGEYGDPPAGHTQEHTQRPPHSGPGTGFYYCT
jgi:hypothetical protein